MPQQSNLASWNCRWFPTENAEQEGEMFVEVHSLFSPPRCPMCCCFFPNQPPLITSKLWCWDCDHLPSSTSWMVSQPPCLKRPWAALEDMASSASLARREPDILPQPSKSRWRDGASHLSYLPVLSFQMFPPPIFWRAHCSSTLSSLSAIFPHHSLINWAL